LSINSETFVHDNEKYMLANNIKNLLQLRQVEKPRQWLLDKGLSARTVTRLLQNEQRHIKFDDIEKLCLGLNCSPAELFVWQPDSEADDIAGHPLQAIRSDKAMPDVLSKLKFASLDELKKVDEFLQWSREKEKGGGDGGD